MSADLGLLAILDELDACPEDHDDAQAAVRGITADLAAALAEVVALRADNARDTGEHGLA